MDSSQVADDNSIVCHIVSLVKLDMTANGFREVIFIIDILSGFYCTVPSTVARGDDLWNIIGICQLRIGNVGLESWRLAKQSIVNRCSGDD